MSVHNHGTEEGAGLACNEQMIDGKLRGACMTAPVPSTSTLREQVAQILLGGAVVDDSKPHHREALANAEAFMPLFAEAEQRGAAKGWADCIEKYRLSINEGFTPSTETEQ